MKTGKTKSRKNKRKIQTVSRSAASAFVAIAVVGAHSNDVKAYDRYDRYGGPNYLDNETQRQIAMLEEQRRDIGLARSKACLFSGAGVLAAGVAMGLAGAAKIAKSKVDETEYTYAYTDKDKRKKGLIIGSVGAGLALGGATMVGVCAKRAKAKKHDTELIDEKIWELKFGDVKRVSITHGGRQAPALVRF